MAGFLPSAVCTLCTASVNVYLREYDQPVQNIDRKNCIWCPISLNVSWTLALGLVLISPAQAQSGFKLYMAPPSNLTQPAAKQPPAKLQKSSQPAVVPTQQESAIYIPTGTNASRTVSAPSMPVGKVYYPTTTGKPVVIDAAQDPAASVTPLQTIKQSKPAPTKSITSTLPNQSQTAVKKGQPAIVAPGVVIHTSADDFVPPAKTPAVAETAKPFTGSAAPTQDPATNKHLGANFSSEEEVRAIKEAAKKRYDYVLPKVIKAPVNFKVVQSSGFVTYVVPSDKLFINDHAVFAIKADKLLEELLPHVVKMADHPLIIRVHTDNLGFDHYNTKLSKARGELLKDWLIHHGSLQNVELEVEALGGRKPLVPNSLAQGVDNPVGRAQNRRVEIFIDTNISVSQKLAAAKAAALAEAVEEQALQANPQDKLQNGMTIGRAQLQQASKGSNETLPAALQEIGPLSDEGMEPAESEESTETASESSDSRQQASWDRVSNNQANRRNLNAEGKRVVPAMTEKEKMLLQKERDWARGEFGLFLEK